MQMSSLFCDCQNRDLPFIFARDKTSSIFNTWASWKCFWEAGALFCLWGWITAFRFPPMQSLTLLSSCLGGWRVCKKNLHFLVGDTCVEIANINMATADLAKPSTCTSPPDKRRGALGQNGNRQRCSSLGERSTNRPQQPRVAFNITSIGNWTQNQTKWDCNYYADRPLASYVARFNSARKPNPAKSKLLCAEPVFRSRSLRVQCWCCQGGRILSSPSCCHIGQPYPNQSAMDNTTASKAVMLLE